MALDSVISLKKLLPKAYQHRKHAACEMFVAISRFKNLQPMVDKYVFNDGSTKDLMSLAGTIPVTYKGKQYNIPVCLWFEENYPQSAPICYVKPTKEMMVVTSKHINSNGEILFPYLQDWRHAECDLSSLIHVMVVMFGEAPPVCVRPSPKPDQATCSQQSQRYAEGLSATEEHSYVYLSIEDGQPFPKENETNC